MPSLTLDTPKPAASIRNSRTKRFQPSAWIIPCLLLMAVLSACHPQRAFRPHPRAEQGILDLQHWDLEKDGALRLDGEWAFYWDRLLIPEDFQTSNPPDKTGFIEVPGIWNNYRIGQEKLPGHGIATYRLQVRLKPVKRLDSPAQAGDGEEMSVTDLTADVPPELALRLRFVQTAYRLYINGRPIAEAGNVATDRFAARPEYRPQVIDFDQHGDQLDIVLQVANFAHHKSGLQSSIRLGTPAAARAEKLQSCFFDVFLFGSLLIMSLYHFGLFWMRRRDRSPLYFSGFCFLTAFRSILVGDYFILQVLPEIDWELLLGLEYITFILPLPLYAMFIRSLYPAEFPIKALRVIQAVTLAYFLLVLVTPPAVYTGFLFPYQVIGFAICAYILFTLVLATRRQRTEAALILAGSLLLFIAVVNDLLHNNLVINTTLLFPFGMFLFILVQALVLSLRFSRAFTDLDELSQSLELKVEQRTEALAERNEQTKQLLHILCHDLQNPLSNIRSIVDMSRDDPEVMTEMRDVIAMAADSGTEVIEMVRNLRTLEDRQPELDLSSQNLLQMLTASLNMLDQRIKMKELEIELDVDPEVRVRVEKTSFVNSVLNNILTNAVKFSYPKSCIRIRTADEGNRTTLIIEDTGIGMSSTLLKDIFNPHKATSRPGTAGETGTGFGMPLVKKFITAYGGDIRIHSQEANAIGKGGGTEIRLLLVKS